MSNIEKDRKKSLQVVEPCDSCGMSMRELDEHGGGDWNNPYCAQCTDKNGKLKSRKQVRESLIKLYMSRMELPRKEIEKVVDYQMKKLPAWKDPSPY